MTTLRFGRADTFIGPLLVAETEHGVAAVSAEGDIHRFVDSLLRRFGAVPLDPAIVDADWVERVTRGELPAIDDRGLSEFDRRVYGVVRDIAAGSTSTYGEVARLANSPHAARAVGGALARCPLFPAVPCHRVVRASDGWSGWGGDVHMKRAMLALESA